MKRKIRSKHNDLLNYFIHDARDLSPAYLASCRKFLKEISFKHQAPSRKLDKLQAVGYYKIMKTYTLTIADVYKNKKQQERFRKYLKEKTKKNANKKSK